MTSRAITLSCKERGDIKAIEQGWNMNTSVVPLYIGYAKLECHDYLMYAWVNMHIHKILEESMSILITGYGSTLYIGIAMVCGISPYTRKFSSCFHFQVILTCQNKAAGINYCYHECTNYSYAV